VSGDSVFVRGRGDDAYAWFTAVQEDQLHRSFVRYQRERFWDL